MPIKYINTASHKTAALTTNNIVQPSSLALVVRVVYNCENAKLNNFEEPRYVAQRPGCEVRLVEMKLTAYQTITSIMGSSTAMHVTNRETIRVASSLAESRILILTLTFRLVCYSQTYIALMIWT